MLQFAGLVWRKEGRRYGEGVAGGMCMDAGLHKLLFQVICTDAQRFKKFPGNAATGEAQRWVQALSSYCPVRAPGSAGGVAGYASGGTEREDGEAVTTNTGGLQGRLLRDPGMARACTSFFELAEVLSKVRGNQNHIPNMDICILV